MRFQVKYCMTVENWVMTVDHKNGFFLVCEAQLGIDVYLAHLCFVNQRNSKAVLLHKSCAMEFICVETRPWMSSQQPKKETINAFVLVQSDNSHLKCLIFGVQAPTSSFPAEWGFLLEQQ